MTKLRSARDLASLALERVGVFPPADAGPDPVMLGRALDRLDLAVGELAGTMRCLWLVRKLAVVPLAAGVAAFDLVSQAAGKIPANDLQFVVDARLRTGTDSFDHPLERVDQRGWDAIHDKASVTAPGRPHTIFIDRTPLLPQVYLHPAPNDATSSLVLAYQAYAPDLTAAKGEVQLAMEVAWHRWAEYQIAADIGSGPVVTLPAQRTAEYRSEAERARSRLEFFSADSGVYPRRVRFRDF